MPSVLLPHAAGGAPSDLPSCCPQHSNVTDADLSILEALTSPSLVIPGHANANANGNRYKRRDAPLDPLLFAAAIMSGPDVTRHHYHHGFSLLDADPSLASDAAAPVTDERRAPNKPRYVSRQAPRRERLGTRDTNKENDVAAAAPLAAVPDFPSKLNAAPSSRTSFSAPAPSAKRRNTTAAASDPPAPYLLAPERPLAVSLPGALHPPPVEVQCLVRTRIPTAHGEIFLHLYRNNRDSKEHLAIVVDPAQLGTGTLYAPPIRSRTLDAPWSATETEMDRIVRGAYTGRLAQDRTTSTAGPAVAPAPPGAGASAHVPLPLIRIHSECFTGETVGSMRCDCGEQLDEAIRRIAAPQSLPNAALPIPGRGVVLYLRQEGRGIGLAAKLRAYNLQDLGHDTVAANLMLGFKSDERRYEIAAAILRDLGLADGVRILTNNPDKIAALAAEGVHVAERVPMVPRAWKCDTDEGTSASDSDSSLVRAPHGHDLDRYLQTKVTRMGHMLSLPPPQHLPSESQ